MTTFGDIRAYLASPVDFDATYWSGLIDLLASFEPRDRLADQVIPYCKAHLEQRGGAPRALSRERLRRLLSGFDVPEAGLVTTLSLDTNTMQAMQQGDLSSSEIARIFTRYDWRSLTHVDASGQTSTLSLLDALVSASITPHLEHLALRGTRIGDQGLEKLATMSDLGRLRQLDIASCQLADRGVDVMLTSSWFPGLTHLSLGGNRSVAAAAARMARRDAPCALTSLEVGGVGGDGDLLAALLFGDGMQKLRELDFSHNRLGDEGLWRVLELSRRGAPRLRSLRMVGCDLGVDGLTALMMMPTLASLEHLDLSWNPLDESGAMLLARADPFFANLDEIVLRSADVEGDARARIARALPNVRWSK